MVNSLPSLWISHLPTKDTKQIDDFSAAIRNSTILSSRLLTILEQMYDKLENAELQSKFYDSPSVSHQQAFNAGKKAALKEVMQLFDFLGA